MDPAALGFALSAGMVASVNPCGFVMLPAYLTLVVAGEGGSQSRPAAVGRAVTATAAMALGFLLVFGTFGLVISPLASSVQRYLPVVTIVIGVAMLALGAWMLAGRELNLLLPRPSKGAPTARLRSMLGYGFAYAIASLSCTIGPFLAVTSLTFREGSIVGGIAGYLAYAAGMALVVGVLAVAVALAGASAARGLRKAMPYVHRAGGAFLLLAGGYVTYYGIYELRVFSGAAAGDDPVVAAMGAIQSTLAYWVDSVGAIPLVIALAVLVVLGTAWSARKLRRRGRDRVAGKPRDGGSQHSDVGGQRPDAASERGDAASKRGESAQA